MSSDKELKKRLVEMLELALRYEREHKPREVTATVTFEIKNPDTDSLVKFPMSIQAYIDKDRRDLAKLLMRKMSMEFPPDYVYQVQRAYMASTGRGEELPARVKDHPGRLEIVAVSGKDRWGNSAMVWREVLDDGGYGEMLWMPGGGDKLEPILDAVMMRVDLD
jgi:hypothetical protein